MNDQQWYYESKGQQTGPIGWEELIAGLQTGMCTKETRVWAAHLPEWAPLGNFLADKVPPPIPQASQQAVPLPAARKTRFSRLYGAILATLVLIGLGVAAFAFQGQNHQRNASSNAVNDTFNVRGLKRLNQSNSFRTFIGLSTRAGGPPHISSGRASQYPDMVLITIVWPAKDAFQVLVNPDEPNQGVAPPHIKKVRLDSIPDSVTGWNCRVDDQGNILLNGHESECLPDHNSI